MTLYMILIILLFEEMYRKHPLHTAEPHYKEPQNDQIKVRYKENLFVNKLVRIHKKWD